MIYRELSRKGRVQLFPGRGSGIGWNIAASWVFISGPNTQPLHISETKKHIFVIPEKLESHPIILLIYLHPVLTPSHPQIFILRPPITYTKQMC